MTPQPIPDRNDYSAAALFLDAVRAVAGEDGIAIIKQLRGGSEVRVSIYATRDHWLSKALGFEQAKKVCDHMRTLDADGRPIGNFRFYLPAGSGGSIAAFVAKTKTEAERLLLAGQSVTDVSCATGLSDRLVKRLRRDLIQTQRLSALSPPKGSDE